MMVAPSARRRSSITSASLLPSRGAATRAEWPPSSGPAPFFACQLRRLARLDRVLRSLVDGDGFQTGHRQFERVTSPCVIAAPDRRSRFRLDLAGQTKLREFDADLAESRALDRCRRRQATVLALRRSAHHHKLRVGKFDTHDPTLPLLPEVRTIRAPHQDEPRIGQSRRGGWVIRAFAPRLTTTPMLVWGRQSSGHFT